MKKIYLFILMYLVGVGSMMAQHTAFGHGAKATGGGNVTPTLVDTESELKTALAKSGNRVIIITNNITVSSQLSVSKGNFTLMALPGKKLINLKQNKKESGIINVKGCSNVIIRNVIFEGPGAYDCDGSDLLQFEGVTNAWVDHCDFQDGCDGNFDNKSTTDNITVSWCRFRYLKKPKAGGSGGSDDHRYTNLIGSDSGDKPSDGRYSMTWAYCWWDEGCVERMTRCRNADLHFLNCYWKSSVAKCYIGPENVTCYLEGCTMEGSISTSNRFKSYGGTNALKSVNSSGIPKDAGSVSAPTYAYDKLSAQDAKAAVISATCGAGATLLVQEDGTVSSPCDSEKPTLTLQSGNKDQVVTEGNSMSSVVFVAGGSATSISVKNLPAGVNSQVNGLLLSLSGKPTSTGTYTVTATDGATNVTLTGTITVKATSSGGESGGNTGDVTVGDELCVDLTGGNMPTVDGVSIEIINDGSGEKATTWESTGVKFNTNKAGIAFDLSALNKKLLSVTFDVELPNCAEGKNTVAYGFTAGATSETYTLSDKNVTAITVNAPAGTTGFTIARTAGTGTFVSKVCFAFEATGDNGNTDQGGSDDGNTGGGDVTTTSDWWNFSDSDFAGLGTITSPTTVRGLTILATAEKSVIVDANVKNVEGVEFTSRMKLSGTGAADARTLTFPVKGTCEIEVYLVSSTSTEERSLNVAAGSFGNVVGTLPAGTTVQKASYRYEGASTTIYLYSPKSGVNLYGVRVTYNGTASDLKENILTDVYYAADVVFNPSNRPIALYNASGMLLEQSVEDISLSKYGHGFYFVRLVDTNQTLKLVK